MQENTLHNIEMLWKARNEVIKLFDDFSSMVPEAKNEATEGKGLKTLTPKQMLLHKKRQVITQTAY